jgi:hypothetical protein
MMPPYDTRADGTRLNPAVAVVLPSRGIERRGA